MPYNLTLPRSSAGEPPPPPASGLPVDLYPLPGSDKYSSLTGGGRVSDAGFSNSALVSLVLIGLVVRMLVYLSLRCMDRGRRR